MVIVIQLAVRFNSSSTQTTLPSSSKQLLKVLRQRKFDYFMLVLPILWISVLTKGPQILYNELTAGLYIDLQKRISAYYVDVEIRCFASRLCRYKNSAIL